MVAKTQSSRKNNNLLYALVASLTLGLAPFNPPHVVGKIKWVAGGAIGMKPIDYFDLFLHGFPWVFLLFQIGIFLSNKLRK